MLSSRGLASHVIGRRLLQEAVHCLGAREIPVMPLKGIWLQQLVYDDPGERPITDVDVLVPDSRYDEALGALQAAGWVLLGSNVSEAALRSPDLPIPLDVHRRLFTRGAFHMPSAELFARGLRAHAQYECDVILPDPLDVFAHLVGHFVKSRGGRDTQSRELRDLPVLAARFSLEPSDIARHLQHCGLARASRYALQCVPLNEDASGVCAATLASLKDDRVGDRCAAGMLSLRACFGARSPVAVLPGFVLECSLPRALRSLVLRAWDRRQDQRPTHACT